MIKIVTNYFVCFFLYLIIYLLKIIGKKNSINFCAFIFVLVGRFTIYNRRANNNLLYIWPKISDRKRKNICFKMWKNLGKNFGEFIYLHRGDPLDSDNVKIHRLKETKSLVDKNIKLKKGVIFFSAHFGNWELGPYIINKLNVDLMGIYRKSNNSCIDSLIQRYRNKNTNYVPKGDLGAKKSFLWLRKGKSLALLMDQKLNEGMSVNFLGKPANTATAIAELALRMNLDIIPIKIIRNKNDSHEIYFLKKIKHPNDTLSHEKKVKNILIQINTHLSEWITKAPEQWLWLHRRWKK